MRQPRIEQMKDRLQSGLESAKRQGASTARLAFNHSEKMNVSFEAGRLKDTGSEETLSYSLNVLVDGRMGHSSGNRVEELEKMIERAIALAKVGSAAHFDAYPAPGEVTSVQKHSDRTLNMTREGIIEDCQKIADALKAYNPDLFVSCSGRRSENEGLVLTSGGVCHESTSTGWGLGGFVQRTQGTDMLFAGYGRGWCNLNEFYNPQVISDRIIKDLRNAETNVEPPTGTVKTYIPAETFAMLLWALSLGFNGRNVAKGESPLKDRLGEQVLAPSITLLDDPHQPFSPSAAEIDADGIPTSKTTIYEKGILKQYLYDLDSAGLANAQPTGHNGCRPYNAKILPGEKTSDELLASIDDGIYIKDVIGFGQGNIMNGDFSGNLGLGYRIKDGKVVGRVKDTMIAGNLYEVLKENVTLSSDLEYTGSYPSAVVEGVKVSSKAG